MSRFIAVLDACVLYPAPLRDLLVSLASEGLYRAKWSDEIHEEWMRNLLENRSDLKREQLDRTCTLMNTSVPDSLVRGYEKFIPILELPDPNDRHVLATAIQSEAHVIVTFNQKDFPPEELLRFDVCCEHPDEFITNIMNIQNSSVLNTVRRLRERLKNPPKNAEEFLETLRNQGLPQTVRRLSEYLNAI